MLPQLTSTCHQAVRHICRLQLRLGALLQPPRNDIIRTHPRPASPHKPHSRERFGTCPSRTAPTSGLGSGFGQHRKTKFTHPKYRSPTFRSMSDILNKTAFLFRHKRKKNHAFAAPSVTCVVCKMFSIPYLTIPKPWRQAHAPATTWS